MRLRRLQVTRSSTCGGLLDGADIWLGRAETEASSEPLEPLCLLGPNGSGKSQFLQLVAEIFQAAWHVHAPDEERDSANTDAIFELDYLIKPDQGDAYVLAKLSRTDKGKSAGPIELHVQKGEEWLKVEAKRPEFRRYLPSLIVGYTSGDNETMSLPFMVSRAGYARSVATAALAIPPILRPPPDNRALLIDYGTNLEVMFANLTMAAPEIRTEILRHARLKDIASCRCIIRLAHSAAPKAPASIKKTGGRKGIQLTDELEVILKKLQKSATCWHIDDKREIYTFDYFIDDATRQSLKHYFGNALELYRALHKFSLLNDLVIPKPARERMRKAVRERRFATRLPEPQQEDMVFAFEEVRFHPCSQSVDQAPVDYVALSDGEHQQSLILGLFSMISSHNALFLLDEPESHFNPQWRVQFVKRLLSLSVERGEQEVLLTSHAPFVPADISKEQVLIFKRHGLTIDVGNPKIETFGTNFDRILENCFETRPPLSQLARDEIESLLDSRDIEKLEAALPQLGASVEKSFVADHLRQLKKRQSD
ncbi:restriction system-associated AAA family ATPase [Methylorubrum extorquens]|uniref:restriction system-associated AAA family ATPase n=1 Tax=Methylorubrum extorquens TaxID=408 RepID=UPI0022389909|nr:restriction system-associated AAA family ATPase [Methylorubrum extorquens]UYW29034.1 restriction system-associated AAA family ATPase [Methylorubrum extorquens]